MVFPAPFAPTSPVTPGGMDRSEAPQGHDLAVVVRQTADLDDAVAVHPDLPITSVNPGPSGPSSWSMVQASAGLSGLQRWNRAA